MLTVTITYKDSTTETMTLQKPSTYTYDDDYLIFDNYYFRGTGSLYTFWSKLTGDKEVSSIVVDGNTGVVLNINNYLRVDYTSVLNAESETAKEKLIFTLVEKNNE